MEEEVVMERATFGDLRATCQQVPSCEAFEALCWCFRAKSSQEPWSQWVDYALSHLVRWSDEVRRVPQAWLSLFFGEDGWIEHVLVLCVDPLVEFIRGHRATKQPHFPLLKRDDHHLMVEDVPAFDDPGIVYGQRGLVISFELYDDLVISCTDRGWICATRMKTKEVVFEKKLLESALGVSSQLLHRLDGRIEMASYWTEYGKAGSAFVFDLTTWELVFERVFDYNLSVTWSNDGQFALVWDGYGVRILERLTGLMVCEVDGDGLCASFDRSLLHPDGVELGRCCDVLASYGVVDVLFPEGADAFWLTFAGDRQLGAMGDFLGHVHLFDQGDGSFKYAIRTVNQWYLYYVHWLKRRQWAVLSYLSEAESEMVHVLYDLSRQEALGQLMVSGSSVDWSTARVDESRGLLVAAQGGDIHIVDLKSVW